MTPQGIGGSITAPHSGHAHDAVLDERGEVWARRECRGGAICPCIFGRGHWEAWQPITAAWTDLFVPDEPKAGAA